MSINTTVQTKKEFLEMMDKIIGDNDAVLWTQNYSTIELKPKLNEKRVTLGFAADAFEYKDGVNDLMRKGIALFGAFVCDRSLLSEGANKLISEQTKTKKTKQ